MVVAPEDEAQALREIVPYQRELGVQTELLAPDEVAERWPELALDAVALACFEETSGYADPVRTVHALVGSARERGLHVYEGCRVVGRRDGRRARRRCRHGRRRDRHRRRRQRHRPVGQHDRRHGRHRVPAPLLTRARGDLRGTTGVREDPRDVGRDAAAVLPQRRARPRARRRGLAEGARARRSRDVRRRHRRCAPGADGAEARPPPARARPHPHAARLRGGVRHRVLRRLRHHRGLVPDRRRGGARAGTGRRSAAAGTASRSAPRSASRSRT